MKLYLTKDRILFLCNLGIEEEWNNAVFTDMQSKFKITNIEEIAMFICGEDDICVVRTAPEKKFLEYMEEIGFTIPEFVILKSNKGTQSFTESVLRNCEEINKYVNDCNISVAAYAYTERLDVFRENVTWLNKFLDVKKWNNKLWMHNLLERYGISFPEGVIVKTKQAAIETYAELRNKGFSRGIIKMPYGASGKGSYLVNDEYEAKTIARICLKNSDEGILVEGYYDKSLSYSYQLNITEEVVSVFFITEQIVEDIVYKGSYWGNELCNRLDLTKIRENALQVGNVLKQAGIRGIVGIDGILGGNQYFPAIDVNVRYTMSTFLSNMSDVFGKNRSYMSWMRDLCLEKPMNYSTILNILEKNNIKYSVSNREGIIVYIEGSLPKTKNDDGLYIGRIYAMCIAHSYNGCLKYRNKFEETIKKEEVVI